MRLDSHYGRHLATIGDEEVAEGSHDVRGDGALGHRQAAVFGIVSTTQSWCWDAKERMLGHRGHGNGCVERA